MRSSRADQANTWDNPQFSRRWETPPKQKRPGPHHRPRTSFNLSNTETINSLGDRAAQRAVRAAARRIADLEWRAEIAAAIGLAEAADRFLGLADAIRSAVLA